MTKLDEILSEKPRQLDMAGLLDAIAQEEETLISENNSPTVGELSNEVGVSSDANGNGFTPGQSVGHTDFDDFRGIFVGPGAKDGQAKVMVKSGWTCDPPTWAVTIPTAKLTEV